MQKIQLGLVKPLKFVMIKINVNRDKNNINSISVSFLFVNIY